MPLRIVTTGPAERLLPHAFSGRGAFGVLSPERLGLSRKVTCVDGTGEKRKQTEKSGVSLAAGHPRSIKRS